jgi:Protein of unknown function (DUF5661)
MKSFKQFLNKKTLSLDDLAAKHKVSVAHLNKQLSKGMNVEKEHTSHEKVAKEIALDHIGEDPHYYDKLSKMENK